MPRKPRFPDLPPKFAQQLAQVFEREAPDAALTGPTIFGRLSRNAFTADEYAFLERNLSNYLSDACRAGTLVALGPWKGYRFLRTAPDDDGAQSEPTATLSGELAVGIGSTSTSSGKIQREVEGFLHLPTVLWLMLKEFGGRSIVRSLPKVLDQVRFANPDLIYARPGPFEQAVEQFQKVEQLRGVDIEPIRNLYVAPRLVMGSIELKRSITSRQSAIQALAEAAANGRWAHEAYLVVYDGVEEVHGTRSSSECLEDTEIKSLAHQLGVGVRVLQLVDDQVRVTFQSEPTTRTHLGVHDLGEQRPKLIATVCDLVRTYDEAPYLEAAADQIADALYWAFYGLSEQHTFVSGREVGDFGTLMTSARALYGSTFHRVMTLVQYCLSEYAANLTQQNTAAPTRLSADVFRMVAKSLEESSESLEHTRVRTTVQKLCILADSVAGANAHT